MPRLKSTFNNMTWQTLVWPLLALSLILLFNLVFTPGFFRLEVRDGHLFGSLIDILNRAAPVLLLSIGMTLVIATGGIDLSVGAVVAITGAVAAMVIRPDYVKGVLAYSTVPSVFTVAGIALFTAMLCGLWNGMLVAGLKIQPIVATLILMVVGRGIAQLITRGQILIFEHPAFQFIGSGFCCGLPFPILIVAAVFLLTTLLTRRTALGLLIESVGGNPLASQYTGINAALVKLIVYVFSGLCAGMAGLVITSDIKGADANNAGLDMEMDAVLAVVIGGTNMNGGRFYLVGSMIGALFVQTLTTTILTRGVNPEITLVVKALVVVAVCLLQSPAFRTQVFGKSGRAIT